MIQQIAIYIVLTLALAYVIGRIYNSIKKKEACGKCVLMEAAKKSK